MADGIKGKLENAGQAVADAAKTVGQKVSEGAGQAADWVKDKVGMGDKAAVDPTSIHPHMPVMSSCGCKVGSVDHVEGGAIKLTLKDSPDGLHHFVPLGWVAKVDEHVHLTKNAGETKQGWKPTAAGCANC